MNPSYYQLQETNSAAINRFLSDVVTNALNELQNSYCIEIEEVSGFSIYWVYFEEVGGCSVSLIVVGGKLGFHLYGVVLTKYFNNCTNQ